MLTGWLLLLTGFVCWSVSGPIAGAYRRHSQRVSPHRSRRPPLWVRLLNPLGLVCAVTGTVLLIGLLT